MAEIEFSLTRRGRKYDAGAGLDSWATSLTSGMTVAAGKMPAAMRQHLVNIVNLLAAKHGNKWPGGTSAGSLSSRSGDLLKSLQAGVKVAGDAYGVAGSLAGVEYLRIQEYGGTLTPHGTQYLAIPLPDALNNDGTPKKDNPRDWDHTFIQQSRRGNLLIFRRSGTGIVPLYALKTSVTIPPRLGARQLAKDQMPYFRTKVLDAILAEFKR
jgi:hypothetical protein